MVSRAVSGQIHRNESCANSHKFLAVDRYARLRDKRHSVFGSFVSVIRRRVCYEDDMAEVLQKMIDADVIVLASPVYFYSIDAQLKAVIDRTVARWLEVKNKELYYIMTAADDTKAAMETTLACLRGYADCVEGAKERGVIYGVGVYEKGKIKDKPVMQEAYTMGKEI